MNHSGITTGVNIYKIRNNITLKKIGISHLKKLICHEMHIQISCGITMGNACGKLEKVMTIIQVSSICIYTALAVSGHKKNYLQTLSTCYQHVIPISNNILVRYDNY